MKSGMWLKEKVFRRKTISIRRQSSLLILLEIIHGDMASADVKLKTPKGETLSYKQIKPDRKYMPHNIDWDALIEDPLTKEHATLKEIMGKTFSQAKRERMLQQIADEMEIDAS